MKVENDKDMNKLNKAMLEYLAKNTLINQYPIYSSQFQNLNENEDYSNNNNNRYLTPYIDQKVLDHIESYLSTHYKNLLYVNIVSDKESSFLNFSFVYLNIVINNFELLYSVIFFSIFSKVLKSFPFSSINNL